MSNWRHIVGGVAAWSRSSSGRFGNTSQASRTKSLPPVDEDGDYSLPRNHRPSHDFDSLGTGTEMSHADKPIPASNVGYKLLQKMGWDGRTGLGKQLQGRRQPVDTRMGQHDLLGLGKQTEIIEKAEETTKTRKKYQFEKQILEDDTERSNREAAVQKEQERKAELQETTRAFYCSACKKQYTTVQEFDTHQASYEHIHTVAIADMKRTHNLAQQSKREKKAKRREEKEMQRLVEMANKQQQQQQEEEGEMSRAAETKLPGKHKALKPPVVKRNIVFGLTASKKRKTMSFQLQMKQ